MPGPKAPLFQLYAKPGPAYLRLGRPAVPKIYDGEIDLTIGKGIELCSGDDAAIIACGIMVEKSLQAAKLLTAEGIQVTVVDMHTIKPIDTELIIRLAKTTGALLTAEEHTILGGLGSAVAEVTAAECPVLVERLGINDQFGQSAAPDQLLEHYGLTVQQIVEKIHLLLKKKKALK